MSRLLAITMSSDGGIRFRERTVAVTVTAAAGGATGGEGTGNSGRRREARAQGAARLFGYLEASDGSGDEYEVSPHLTHATEFTTETGGTSAGGGGAGGGGTPQFTRDKENAAPHAHSLHHDHCLRY